jgi:hypothetical protein
MLRYYVGMAVRSVRRCGPPRCLPWPPFVVNRRKNLVIVGLGALLGIAGGLGANLWMATHLGTGRMSWVYVDMGAPIVLALSQLAVLWPAYRAASISPSLATRGL